MWTFLLYIVLPDALRLSFYNVIIMARHPCYIESYWYWYLFKVVLEWLWFDVWLSGPFITLGVKSKWHFVFTLHWFAKLLTRNTKIYPVLFPKRGWHFCCSEAFSFSPEEHMTAGFFNLLLPLYLYCTSLLSKQSVDEFPCLLNVISTGVCCNFKFIQYFEKLCQFCYSRGIEPFQTVALDLLVCLLMSTQINIMKD